MIAVLDVGYAEAGARTACALIHAFSDAEPAELLTRDTPGPPAPYEPGAFYRRELPLLLDMLAALEAKPGTVVIDGYVWLSGGAPGLGAHLHKALQGPVVIGVAKTMFRGDDWSDRVLRGRSRQPLFVTAAGIEPEAAAGAVQAMHGPHRVPTLLRLVDQATRIRALDPD